MKMRFSTSVWKYIFLGLNTVMSMLGMMFISSGVVALGGVGSSIGAYGITLLGSIVFSICFLGCFASLRESYHLSIIFIVVSAVGALLQLAFMIALLVMKETFEEMGVKRIINCWENELQQPGSMDSVQYLYSCCGKESPQDYIHDGDDVIPTSCCLNKDCSNPANIFGKGCTSNIVHFFDVHSINMILLSLGIIVVEILSLLSAYYMVKGVDKKKDEKKVDQLVVAE